MFRPGECYHDESLRPPPESGDGDGMVDSWDWGEALIDSTAYMIEERNHTSARCPFFDVHKNKEEELQVTFHLAPPPHISYFCVGYTSGEPTKFYCEPKIIYMEGNIALMSLMDDSPDPSECNYLVYRAPIHGDDRPMLSLVPRPNPELFVLGIQCYLHQSEVGIVRYSTRKGTEQPRFTPPTPSLTLAPATTLSRRHKSNSDDCDAYKIASLYARFDSGIKYDLYIYDSKDDAWTCKATAFAGPPPEISPRHLCDKVITTGGTMGWVDLSCGIILCDVHVVPDDGPMLLRYIPLPEPRQPANIHPSCLIPSFYRDIVVVQGCIKFVALLVHAAPGSDIPNGWTAMTWSMELGDSGFTEDGELHSRDIVNYPLEPSLFVADPTLSLQDDAILYLMTTVGESGPDSRVIAVNMKMKKLEGVAKFTMQRNATIDFAYKRTTISNYLSPDPKLMMKRRLPTIGRSSRKKPHPAIKFMSKQSSGYDGQDDGDNMVVE